MKDQHDPVTNDEYVLRRISNNPQWYKLGCDEPIQRVAFVPNKNDIDGISVFREMFVTARRVAEAGENKKGYYVARLSVAELENLGLTVRPDPQDGQPPGHSLIPQLSFPAYENNPDTCKEIQRKLVKLACVGIVYTPP